MAEEKCPQCGGPASVNYFDRSKCPDPCSEMHTRCKSCHYPLDGYCPWDVPVEGDHEQ